MTCRRRRWPRSAHAWGSPEIVAARVASPALPLREAAEALRTGRLRTRPRCSPAVSRWTRSRRCPVRHALALYRLNQVPEAIAELEVCRPVRRRRGNTSSCWQAAWPAWAADRALDLFGLVLARHPEEAAVWVSFGQTLRIVGRRDEAIAAFTRAIALAPTLGEAWWSLADLKTKSPRRPRRRRCAPISRRRPSRPTIAFSCITPWAKPLRNPANRLFVRAIRRGRAAATRGAAV